MGEPKSLRTEGPAQGQPCVSAVVSCWEASLERSSQTLHTVAVVLRAPRRRARAGEGLQGLGPLLSSAGRPAGPGAGPGVLPPALQ